MQTPCNGTQMSRYSELRFVQSWARPVCCFIEVVVISSLRCLDAPMAMVNPCALLAFFAAVLCTAASSTLGKLPCELLPLAALVVCTLPDPPSGVVLAAQVTHNHTSPVLHVLAVVTHCELLDKGEDIEIVRQEVFFLLIIFATLFRVCVAGAVVMVKKMKLLADPELWNEMRPLEILSEVAVLGNVCEELQRHENIFVARHSRKDLCVCWSGAIQQVSWDSRNHDGG